jgi:hypothetical protein
MYKTLLKQYCENRSKQINTEYGQSEFHIRQVVCIYTTVFFKEMCDILKADSCPSDGTPQVLTSLGRIAMYSENRWTQYVNYVDEVCAGPIMCSRFPFYRNLPHMKLSRMELKAILGLVPGSCTRTHFQLLRANIYVNYVR